MIFHSHKMTAKERDAYTVRWRWKFAFFPKRVGSDLIIWLGWYQKRFQTKDTADYYWCWDERRLNPECPYAWETDKRAYFKGGW